MFPCSLSCVKTPTIMTAQAFMAHGIPRQQMKAVMKLLHLTSTYNTLYYPTDTMLRPNGFDVGAPHACAA